MRRKRRFVGWRATEKPWRIASSGTGPAPP
jgi:hypothetical protein